MSTKNQIWKEYIVLGHTVNIYNSEGILKDKRDLFPNIDDILVLENRISFLRDNYNQKQKDKEAELKSPFVFNPLFLFAVGFGGGCINSRLINLEVDSPISLAIGLSFIIGAFSTGFALNKHKSTLISNNYRAVNKLYEAEMERYNKSISELLKDPIDDSKIVRNKFIPISKDKDYGYELVGRESIFENYGKMRRKMKGELRRDRINDYLDSIGCSEDDKLIFLDLLKGECKVKEQKIANPQYTKK